MNREIKFRARKNSTKEWIYGSLLTDDDGGYAIIQIRHNPISNGVVSGWCFGIEKGTECQYTGLKDKNGKEIYEGDIVDISHPCWSAKCVVEFIDGAFFFIEKNNPANNSWVRSDKFLKEKWKIEVIGNIYENPELINH